MPPWLALALGLITAAALALTFRYDGAERRVLRESPHPDALQIAYLNAWLTANPNDHGLRLVLARGLTQRGEFAAARAHLRALESGLARMEPVVADRAVMQFLDTDMAALYSLSPSDPRYAQELAAVRDRLGMIARQPRGQAVEARLIEQAIAVGARETAAALYARALIEGHAHGTSWWQQAAEQMLGLGDVPLAVRLLMRARDTSRTLEGQRRQFIAALQALRGANRMADALVFAETEIGALAGDVATLEYLTRLALAAGRPDLAQRYAQQMLRLSLLPAVIRAWQSGRGPAPPRELVELIERLPPSLRLAQAELPAPEREPGLAFDDARYLLSYEVFLANSNLRDAIVVARAAVKAAPRSLPWRQRLAQVADWAGDAPLALEQWHAIALQTGSEEAWQQVEKRAPAVFDHDRFLQAQQRRLQRSPDNLELIHRIAELHEHIGEPERALAFLQQQSKGKHRRILLRNIADLAERLGNDPVREQTFIVLTREFGPQTDIAAVLASYALARNDRAGALARMREARDAAQPDDAEYWSAYAELARAHGETAEALAALQVLLAGGKPQLGVLLDAAQLLEEDNPLRAAELTLRAYRQTGTPLHAARVLMLYDRAGSREAALAFVDGLSREQLEVLEGDVGFLQQRLVLRLATDTPRLAVADARLALKLSPGNPTLRGLLLWSLVVLRDAPVLRAELRALTKEVPREPDLWGPVGAAWLALNEPALALPYLSAQARSTRDYLWLLTLADATELSGDVERAWRLRNVAWREIRAQRLPADAPIAEFRQRRARLATLAPIFEPGDRARARFSALVDKDADRVEPLAREALLAAFISTEQNEVALAWLLAKYRHALARPAWAELSLALATYDQPWLGRLLDDVPDWLPLYDRVEAAQRAGRIALAQNFAFEGLAAQPINDELHLRLKGAAVPGSSFVGGGLQRFAQKPLAETSFGIDAAEIVVPSLQLFGGVRRIERRNTDSSLLVEALPNETVATIGAQMRLEHEGLLRATVQRGDGLRQRTTLQLDGEQDLGRRLRLSVSAARAAPSTESPTLRIGGSRDALAANVLARVATREYVSMGLEFNRYQSGDGASLGRGRTLRLEAGHDLRLEYPELRLRASVADSRISADGGTNALLAALLPEPARSGATNAAFLPSAGTRLNLWLAAGESARDAYTRAWRPFGTIGISYESTRAVGSLPRPQSGSGIDWALGAAGSVAGTDRLLIGVEGGSRRGPGANAFVQVAVRYQWLH